MSESEFNLDRENMQEVLRQKGFLVEDYDKETDRLFKKITNKGKSRIKKILKDPEYIEIFKNMIKDELKETKPEFRTQRLNQIIKSVVSL